MARRLRGWGAGVSLLAMACIAMPSGAAEEDPAAQYQWGLDQARVRPAWAIGEGEGVVIAIVDTGVDLDHEDLADHLVPGYNVFDPARKPEDDHGRGTHVAGLAAALRANGKGVAGVAPKAKIMPIKALGFDGLGEAENVAIGVRWAADRGADVIEITIGEQIPAFVGSALRDAIRYAWSKGAIPVVSAGPRVRYTPGFADEPALVVAATTRAGGDPAYESEVGGARWGIAAPGGAGSGNDEEDVLSTYWPHSASENGQTRQYGRYAYLAGTAQSAAHVAGAAAVLRGLGLEPQQVVDRLLVTARDIGAPGRDNVFGAGLLDLQAATAGLRPRTRPSTTTTTTTAADASTTTTTEPNASTTTTAPTRPTTTIAPSGSPSPAPSMPETTTAPAQSMGDEAAPSNEGSAPWVPLGAAVTVAAAATVTVVLLRRRASG